MEASQSLDFVALESRAVRMLEESEAARARIRSEYAVVLVDEAQDLSPLQYRLLTSLGIEAEMMVGDSQQSIYGFRQADVRLFLEKSQQTETLFLSKNHRSDPGILAFVDHVFRQEWGDDYRAMGPGSESFDPSRPPAPWEGVELWEQRAKDTAQVARWIAELLDEGVRPGEIAVLVRERSYAHSLIAKLDGLEINYRLVGGSERFYTRLEVRDLANALTCLSDPYDDFALLATLRSPIAGLSLDSIALLAMRKPVVEALSDFEPPVDEDRQLLAGFLTWYEPLRKCADRRPAYELLIELFARAPYWENLAARPRAYQTLANVRKLFRLAASHPEMGAEELSSRLREIRDLRHREGDAPAIDDQADAVSVLTIHKAKGLEFPIVVLPDMFGRLVRQVGEIETEKWLGVVAAEFEGPKCAYLQWIAERRKERERAELMRVLYVGMTRAQKRLCLVTHPLASTSNLAGRVALLSGFVDGELPGVRVRR
jgi:ATP-dependent exoDNAse (exonuclease V) beta subunit